MIQIRPVEPMGFWEKLSESFKASRRVSKYKNHFAEVKTYCMFLGYPRSGHSLVGAVLDAHSDIVIAHELDAIKYVEAGFSKEKIFTLLIERSEEFTKEGNKWAGYKYNVPNQWNGRFKKLSVIGDKKGGRSCFRLIKDQSLLDKLRSLVEVPIKFVHITRNPYDNISTMFTKKDRNQDLDYKIHKFFTLCEGIKTIKQNINADDLFEISLEKFISEPQENLRALCNFLGEEAPQEYLENCNKLIFEKPKNTRTNIDWDEDSIKKVQDKIDEYDFMKGYSYND